MKTALTMGWVALLALGAVAGRVQDPAPPPTPPPAKPAPPPVEETCAAAHRAIRQGFKYLRDTQNKDGSWGSHDPVTLESSQLGFGLTSRGAQESVLTACTAICAKALMGYPLRTKEDDEVFKKAVEKLIKDWKNAYDLGESFNVWGYTFNLEFQLALLEHPSGAPYAERIRKIVPPIIAAIKKFQMHEGGWTYYSGPDMTGASMSFVTGTVMLPLIKAKKLGFEVPEAMITDAAKLLKKCMYPDKTYMYGYYLKDNARHALEELGAGGRTQVNALALHHFDNSFTPDDLVGRSEYFFKVVPYVEKIGNKRIVPHRDAPHNISGYFFYYGCYYAAEVMTYVGPKKPSAKNWPEMGRMMVRTQEKDGSWFDTMAYDYGHKWGTGFALQVLEQFLQSQGRLDREK